MDPLNLLVGINLFVNMSANYSAAKTGLKISFTKALEKPDTYLQKLPPNVSALVLIVVIAGIFNFGVLDDTLKEEYSILRYVGLALFVIFSWLQVYSFKSLKENYAQEILILKKHNLITDGIYKFVRHPQYLSQILSDLGAALAVMSFIAIPIVLLLEIPLFILRAKFEERLLQKHFKKDYEEYKKKTGFLIPFVG